eukprot:gene24519-biopygen1383
MGAQKKTARAQKRVHINAHAGKRVRTKKKRARRKTCAHKTRAHKTCAHKTRAPLCGEFHRTNTTSLSSNTRGSQAGTKHSDSPPSRRLSRAAEPYTPHHTIWKIHLCGSPCAPTEKPIFLGFFKIRATYVPGSQRVPAGPSRSLRVQVISLRGSAGTCRARAKHVAGSQRVPADTCRARAGDVPDTCRLSAGPSGRVPGPGNFGNTPGMLCFEQWGLLLSCWRPLAPVTPQFGMVQ